MFRRTTFLHFSYCAPAAINDSQNCAENSSLKQNQGRSVSSLALEAKSWHLTASSCPFTSQPQLPRPLLHRLQTKPNVRIEIHAQLPRALNHILAMHSARK